MDVQDDLELPTEVEQLVFRTAQEAVRNAGAHAAAGHVQIGIGRSNGLVRLRVSDDGTGFAPGQRAGRRDSLGLELLAGLASQQGGRLEVRSAPGAGTQLELHVPRRVAEPVPA